MIRGFTPKVDPLRKILIVGGGTAGWMAAAMLARVSGPQTSIALIESDAIGTVGVGEATIPPIRQFNKFCQIDEAEFLKETSGTFKVGIQFENWGKIGDCYLHAFGRVARELDAIVKMHHWWLHGRNAGSEGYPRWEELFLGRHAMDQGRYGFDPSSSAARPVRPTLLPHAYHFDAVAFAGLLRRSAEGRKVTRLEGQIEKVERDPESGDVASVHLNDGRTLSADLFIDCSGFRSLLLGEAMGEPFDDWSKWLPADRAVVVQSENISGAITPGTRAIAHAVGWQWRIPLQHRTGNGHVYSSSFSTDEDAKNRLVNTLDTPSIGDPRVLKFSTGRRQRAWVGNVVALGLSAGFLEPLESTSIHLVQASIERLVDLFPSRQIEPALRDDFNRRTEKEWAQIRDFIIAHYKVNQRDDSEFWKYCREVEVPESLSETLNLWGERGGLSIDGGHLFQFASWAALLLGQNLLPRALHGLVSRVDARSIAAEIRKIPSGLQQQASQMPDHAEFVRAYCGN